MDNPHYIFNSEAQSESEVPWGIYDVVFVYFCIFILSIIFVGGMLYSNLDVDRTFFSIVFQTLLSFSILVLIYGVVSKKYNVPFKKAFGISFTRMPSFINAGILITAIIIITTTVIGVLFSLFFGAKSQSPYSDMPIEKFRWFTLLAIFFAPVVEEIFFRGFMQPALIKRTGVYLGIIITAVIFGISHTQYFDFGSAMISVTAIGLILGIARHKTGSVMPGVFAHFFNNLLAVAYILT